MKKAQQVEQDFTPTALRREQLRAEMARIAEQNGGYLSPESVVDAARNENSPLHDRFEWDDSVAARHHRNLQAGVLIRMIKITVVRQPTSVKELQVTTTREYQSLPSDRKSKEVSGSFQPVVVIMSDAEKRKEMLATVLKELSAYRKRYADIAELADVWTAIDGLI